MTDPDTTTARPPAPRLTHAQMIEKLLAALSKHASDHGSVSLSRNSRGETQIEVTVRTGEGDIETIEQARDAAKAVYDKLATDYPRVGNGET